MKRPPMTAPADFGSSPPHCAALYVASTVNANLKTLSFAAPKNCVRKNGRNLRSLSRANWLRSDIRSALRTHVVEHGRQRLLDHLAIDLQVDFAARALR